MAKKSRIGFQGPQTFEAYAMEVLGGPRPPAKTGKGVSLLLTCIDYRYPKRIADAMQRITPVLPYDQFILAGASLGACIPTWQDVLVDHVKVALAVGHQIERLVILDHRDCGAYQKPREMGVPEDILETALPKDVLPSVEKKCHEEVLSKLLKGLRPRLLALVPKLEIDAWLLTRDEDDQLKL